MIPNTVRASGGRPPQTAEIWAGNRGCRVTFEGDTLKAIDLFKGKLKASKIPPSAGPAIRRLCRELKSYLDGDLKKFTFKVQPSGPPFYKQVYAALDNVPYGKVVSYGELAVMAGRPGAARAVGSAMARNPFPLLVPCHRVVASGGKPGGFGYGLVWKSELLEMEKAS